MADIEGEEAFFAQLTALARIVEEPEFVKGVNNAWSIVTNQILDNALIEFEVRTGLLFDPQTILTNTGITYTNGTPYVYSEAGVFKDDSAMTTRGLDASKDIPAATYAYWLEYGTQPHYNESGVKAKHPKRSGGVSPGEGFNKDTDEMKVTAGIQPSFFISRAYDTMRDKAYDLIQKDINVRIDKVLL